MVGKIKFLSCLTDQINISNRNRLMDLPSCLEYTIWMYVGFDEALRTQLNWGEDNMFNIGGVRRVSGYWLYRPPMMSEEFVMFREGVLQTSIVEPIGRRGPTFIPIFASPTIDDFIPSPDPPSSTGYFHERRYKYPQPYEWKPRRNKQCGNWMGGPGRHKRKGQILWRKRVV